MGALLPHPQYCGFVITAIGGSFPTACRGGRLESNMGALKMESLLPIILQLVAGAVGGNVGGAAMKTSSLGGLGNTIAGALGGVGGGSLLGPLLGMAGGAAGGIDIGNLAASGVGGIVLQIVAGLIKSQMNKSA
jgi:hypothetical protein